MEVYGPQEVTIAFQGSVWLFSPPRWLKLWETQKKRGAAKIDLYLQTHNYSGIFLNPWIKLEIHKTLEVPYPKKY